MFFLLLGVDLLKLSSLLNDFNHYVLSDALTLLFSILFIVFDLFFVFSSYRLSTKEQLIARCTVEENKKKAALQTVQPQALKFTAR